MRGKAQHWSVLSHHDPSAPALARPEAGTNRPHHSTSRKTSSSRTLAFNSRDVILVGRERWRAKAAPAPRAGSSKTVCHRHCRQRSQRDPARPPEPKVDILRQRACKPVVCCTNTRVLQLTLCQVFPGGNYDKRQDNDRGLLFTAVRELFEESGLLLVHPTSAGLPSDAELDVAREDIHAQKRLFRDFLSQHGLKPNLEALLPFTQWITPPAIPKYVVFPSFLWCTMSPWVHATETEQRRVAGPIRLSRLTWLLLVTDTAFLSLSICRRFHTQFYVTFLDETRPAGGFSSGDKQERLPTPDGGQEVIAARFVHPGRALDEFRAQQISLFPPQYYLLKTLADVLIGARNTPEQRERVRTLSKGVFGRMVINPRPTRDAEAEKDGFRVLAYEGDETHGGSPGRRHRCRLKFGQGGVRAPWYRLGTVSILVLLTFSTC